jgi:hypothetical protein
MKTDDDVIEALDRALMQVSAPIDDLIDGARAEVSQLRRRRKVYAAAGVVGVAAAVTAVVLAAGVVTRGDNHSGGPVGQPTTSASQAAATPRMQQMLALLEDLAPGHDYSGLELQFDGESGIQLWGTVDRAFFTVFVMTSPEPDNSERDLASCDRQYSAPQPAPDAPFCRGGYRSYPDGTSRLLLRDVGLDRGEVGLDRPVIDNTVLVWFPDGVNVGVTVSNSSDIASPPAPVMDLPVFTLDELEQMMTDPRWDKTFAADATVGSSGKD